MLLVLLVEELVELEGLRTDISGRNVWASCWPKGDWSRRPLIVSTSSVVEVGKNDSNLALEGSLLNMGLVRTVWSSRKRVESLNMPASDSARLVFSEAEMLPGHWRAALPEERFERRDYQDVGYTIRGSGPRNCNWGWLQRDFRTAGWNECWK